MVQGRSFFVYCYDLDSLISPAGDFQTDAELRGRYFLGGEELVLNGKYESIISYSDYAIAMADEIEKGNHIQQRISVVRKKCHLKG